MLAEDVFRLYAEPENLWAKVTRNKNDIDLFGEKKNSGLRTWRALQDYFPLIRDNVSWTLGSGRSIRIWMDVWILPKPLK